MPVLPLHAAEPLTAVLGVMLYPADEDLAARDCWEALTLAPIVAQYRARRGNVEDALIDWILAHCGPFCLNQNDLTDRWAGGTMTGELVCVLQWLTAEHPDIASWSRAVEWLEAMGQTGFTRSAIYSHKARFDRVAHLWGAYSLTGRKIVDLQAFWGFRSNFGSGDRSGVARTTGRSHYFVGICGYLQKTGRIPIQSGQST